MAEATLVVERDPPLARVTLNRPHVRNAIDTASWRALYRTFEELAGDAGIRVVVLRGAGGPRGHPAFSAGADIAEFRSRRVGRELAREYHLLAEQANAAVENCPKPVIAQIAGFALGAALALAAACDLRVAGANAKLGVPAARIGLTLGLNDTRRLVGAVGAAHTRDLLLTGRILDAREALAMGLVSRVVPVAKLEAETEALARAIASQAPLPLQQAKANTNTILRNPGLSGVDEVAASLLWADSEDFVEGIAAFLEGRRPTFKGR